MNLSARSQLDSTGQWKHNVPESNSADDKKICLKLTKEFVFKNSLVKSNCNGSLSIAKIV